MLLSEVEKLKRELTDKFVVVHEGIPELRRFVGRTGVVKTVNMNGRALVQFQGLEDIAWYDIDPRFLTVVDKPIEPAPAERHEPAAAAKPTAKAAAKPAGASPLELARQQGPAKAEGEKKLSPLELARMQGPAKTGAPAQSAAGKGAAPEAAQAAPEGKKLSPLELARMQGPAKRGSEAAAPSAAATTAPGGEQPASQAAAQGKTLSPLELARMQGPAKRPETDAASSSTAAGGDDAGAGQSASEQAQPASDAGSSADASATKTPAQGGKQFTGPDGRTLSPLELARLQGPFKGNK